MKKIIFFILLFAPVLLIAQNKVVDVSSMAVPGAPVPTITPSLGSLGTPFSTGQGTPSTSQTFTVSGSLLTAAGTVSASSGYEVSLNNSTFAGTQNLPVSSGDFTGHPVSIYVRLTGTFTGTFNGFVFISSTGASTAQVGITGTVTSVTPTLMVTGSLTAFSTAAGTPSVSQDLTVSGSSLTNDCVITWPSSFEGSVDGGSSWGSPKTITHSGTALTGGTVTVKTRIAASASAGSPLGNVAFTSTGATTVNISASGTVSSAAADDTIQVNLTDGQSAASMHQVSWNNWSPTIAASVPQTSGVFNYKTGVASPITATVTQYSGVTAADYYDNTLAFYTGNTMGFPDTTLRLVFGWFDDGPDSLIINNLPTATNNYSIILASSRNTGFDRSVTITCNGVTYATNPYNAQNNTTTAVRFDNVVKNGNSKIIIKFLPNTTLQTSGNRASYLNAFKIIKHN